MSKTDELAKKMFPESLLDVPGFEPDEGEYQTLTQIASDVCDDLEGTYAQPVEKAAVAVISALQKELNKCRRVINQLKNDVDEAQVVFETTCDCGECGPCNLVAGFERHTKQAEKQMARIKLAEM